MKCHDNWIFGFIYLEGIVYIWECFTLYGYQICFTDCNLFNWDYYSDPVEANAIFVPFKKIIKKKTFSFYKMYTGNLNSKTLPSLGIINTDYFELLYFKIRGDYSI